MKKNYWPIAIIITAFVILRIAFALRFHTLIWDEAVYLSMGKYIFSLGSTGLWEMIRPPGLPLFLGVLGTFTPNYVFAAELLVTAFAAGSILLVYLIGKELNNEQTGLIAAFLIAITPVFFLYSGFILTGIPSTFFILLGILYLYKGRFAAAGIAVGIASQFRFPQGLFIVAVGAALLLTHYFIRNRYLFEQAKDFITSFIGIHIPFLVFNFFMYNAETSRIYHAVFRPWILGGTHTQNPAEALSAPWVEKYAYYVVELFKQNEILIFALVGICAYILLKKYKDFKFNILITSLVIYLGFFSYIINKQVRFSLGFLYIICLLSAFGIVKLIDYLSQKGINKKHLFTGACILIFIFSFVFIFPEDEKYLGYRPLVEPPIVTEFYRYFENNNIDTPVLTADPVLAAYNDNRFIPIYYSLALANQSYEKYKDRVEYLVYTNETFFCAPEDLACITETKEFAAALAKNDLVFNKSFGHPEVGYRQYYIYKLTST